LKLLSNVLVGGYSKAGLLGSKDGERDPALDVWEQVLAKTPTHEGHDLKALGQPVVLKKQVVAGTNYMFGFESGASVSVFHQPWTSTLQVSSVMNEPSANQMRLMEWSRDVEGLQSLLASKKAGRPTDEHPESSSHSLVELTQSSSSSRSDLRAGSRLSSRSAVNRALAMFLMGGWSSAGLLESEGGSRDPALDVWDKVVKKTPEHEGHDLIALGKPIVVKKQVVAGTNYLFGFESGASVVVFHQPWSGTLEVSSVHDNPSDNKASLAEWSKDVGVSLA
jgi:hypothetical protein